MPRPEYFPEDWIMPGEFSFCGTCGRDATFRRCPWQLRAPCFECLYRTSRHGISAEEAAYWLEEGEKIAAEVRSIREQLAASRRESGLPGLFWMKMECTTTLHIQTSLGITLAAFEVRSLPSTRFGKPWDAASCQKAFIEQLKEAIAQAGLVSPRTALGLAVARMKDYIDKKEEHEHAR